MVGFALDFPNFGLVQTRAPEDFLDLALVILEHLIHIAGWPQQRPRVVNLVSRWSIALLLK